MEHKRWEEHDQGTEPAKRNADVEPNISPISKAAKISPPVSAVNHKISESENEDESPEKIYISKYFVKKDKEEKSDAKKNEEKVSWFDELDKEQKLDEDLIYRTDKLVQEKTKFPKLGKLENIELKSTPASSQEFKPVLSQKTGDENKAGNEVKARNPFAIKKKSLSPQIPLAEVISNSQESVSQESQSSSLCESVKSLASLISTPNVSIDQDSFDFSPQTLVQAANCVSKSVEKTSSSSNVSSYFQKSAPSPAIRKPKGMSGLLKRPPSDKKQRSLIDMWKKK